MISSKNNFPGISMLLGFNLRMVSAKKIFAFVPLFFVLAAVFSQSQKKLTYSQMISLVVAPQNERNYAGQECCFELKIPYTKADSVQASIPDLPVGVNFVSMRRSDYSEDENGTKIELWLNFSEPGTYELRVMRITVSGKIYPIKFMPVTIFENPRDLLPQLVIKFDNGVEFVRQKKSKASEIPAFSAEVGTKLKFTVYLQYAVQLISFDWEVPRDSIFSQTSRHSVASGIRGSTDFSEELIPVSSFEWQPLTVGNMMMPKMRFVAISYNGTRSELSLPDSFIQVNESPVSLSSPLESEENHFPDAFENSSTYSYSPSESVISKKDCENIAFLRSKERRSLPFGSEAKTRRDFENSVGISDGEAEPVYFGFWIFFSLSLLGLIFSVFFIFSKKIVRLTFFSIFSLFFALFAVISMFRIKKDSGIFTGGKIAPIPEFSVDGVESINAGKKVFVEQKAGNWLYIRNSSSGGWTLSENVIPIR